MNKWIMAVAMNVLALSAQANDEFFYCGYKDYFRLSDASHPGIYIVSSFSDEDLVLQLIGPRSFVIRDSYKCHSGYAHVTVGYNANNWCVLDIKDGPLMNHPRVNASCHGLRYIKTEYEGIGSHSYTIYLD